MRKRLSRRLLGVIICAGALLASACGSSNEDVAQLESQIAELESQVSALSAGSSTTLGEDQSELESASPSTTVVSAPLTSAVATSTTAAELPAGMPGQWYGIRHDVDANVASVEELDGSTGSTTRTIRSTEILVCLDDAPDGSCLVYADVWVPLTIDVTGDLIGLGMCCEPVIGSSLLLNRTSGEQLLYLLGSEIALRSAEDWVVTVDYSVGGYYLKSVADGSGSTLPVAAGEGEGVAWSRDGSLLAFESDQGITVGFFEAGELIDVGPELVPPAGYRWTKPVFQLSGNVVVAQDALDGSGPSQGVVLDRSVFGGMAGTLVAGEFGYGGTITHQDYDESGRFLIYVLDDGRVLWQGIGLTGELAPAGSGFVAAAW